MELLAVTRPPAFIVAIPVDTLLQEPPGVPSASRLVVPRHKPVLPVMGSGLGFTVSVTTAAQPVAGSV